MIEIINPYTVKILITAKNKDSIRAISKRINLSYAWTYHWVKSLEDYGIRIKDNRIAVEENENYNTFREFIFSIFKKNMGLKDAYLLPSLSSLEYAFCKTDAVFFWTKGGYNIGRSKESYPIFIQILKKDIIKWIEFFSRFGVETTIYNEKKKGIYFILEKVDKIEKETVDNINVTPLNKTTEWAKKYIYNFEPALEMLKEMYNVEIDTEYKEAVTNF